MDDEVEKGGVGLMYGYVCLKGVFGCVSVCYVFGSVVLSNGLSRTIGVLFS